MDRRLELTFLPSRAWARKEGRGARGEEGDGGVRRGSGGGECGRKRGVLDRSPDAH